MFEKDGPQIHYTQVRMILECESRALTVLPKVDARGRRFWYPRDELWLVAYFQFVLFASRLRQALGLRGLSAALELAAVLQYFANVMGERIGLVRLKKIVGLDYGF
jgi:hypothetical protein